MAPCPAAFGKQNSHADHLNTPRLIAEQNQHTVWRWDQQEPFGVNVADENPSGLGAFSFNLRFPGQYADKETNLNYNWRRDYDALTGRYITSDPIGLRGGINTYAYVEQNPLSNYDVEGLQVRLVCRPAIGSEVLTASLQVIHCFVYVTCPQEGWSLTLSLTARYSYWHGFTGRKVVRTDPNAPSNVDNPMGGTINYSEPIKPNNDCKCGFEKNVLSRYEQAPDDLAYHGFFGNSNIFAQYLITSPTFGTSLPSNVPANAPGFTRR